MADAHDVVVIGAGHNGLACATLLAHRELDVVVLERRDRAGGAIATEELVDGSRFSTCAFAAHLLHERVLAAVGVAVTIERFARVSFTELLAETFASDHARTVLGPKLPVDPALPGAPLAYAYFETRRCRAGVDVRLDTAVRSVLVERRAATGVELADGEMLLRLEPFGALIPNLPTAAVGGVLLGPAELEARVGLTDGASTHPGGEVSGVRGFNAAQAVLASLN